MVTFSSGAQADGLKASFVLDEMDTNQTNAYLSGVVEGLAYARYINDNRQPELGMKCILDWYYNGGKTASKLVRALNHFKDHSANAVVGVLAKKECGE